MTRRRRASLGHEGQVVSVAETLAGAPDAGGGGDEVSGACLRDDLRSIGQGEDNVHGRPAARHAAFEHADCIDLRGREVATAWVRWRVILSNDFEVEVYHGFCCFHPMSDLARSRSRVGPMYSKLAVIRFFERVALNWGWFGSPRPVTRPGLRVRAQAGLRRRRFISAGCPVQLRAR